MTLQEVKKLKDKLRKEIEESLRRFIQYTWDVESERLLLNGTFEIYDAHTNDSYDPTPKVELKIELQDL